MALTQPDTPVAVAHIAIRYLRERGPVEEEELLRRLAPLKEQQAKAAKQTVSTLLDIGVFKLNGIAVELSQLAAEASTEPSAVANCLFANSDPAMLWSEEKPGSLTLAGGIDLLRALTWFLTLDSFDGPYSFDKGKNQIAARQTSELGAKVLVNNTRWLPFARWASYLGFARLSDDGLAVDPTKALRWALEDAARESNSWTHSELSSLLASRLPVLDSGDFADSIRARMGEHGVESDAEADFSSALTLALRVLSELRLVELEEGAGDATKARFAKNLGAVHRVTWIGTHGG